jgi:hypothetical protein
MGGKRIAEQVRRALIVAAKVAPVAVVIDASGCGCTPCAGDPADKPNLGGGMGGVSNTGGFAGPWDSGPVIFLSGGGTMGMGGRGGRLNARDASQDAPSKSDASTDASKDGG